MTVKKSALDFKGIFFRTRRRQFILPRCPPGHFLVDGIPVDGDARRKSVQDAPIETPWDSPKIVSPRVCPKVFILSFLLFNHTAQGLEILPEVRIRFTDAFGAFNTQGLTAALGGHGQGHGDAVVIPAADGAAGKAVDA